MHTLNLGILAHVDAGKTTLTERLLYAAGAIDALGSVDEGTTQTDSLTLERQRGITIRAAVVAFTVGDLTVNIIDTPGHPDFIAEVERSLAVLDGAVLVLSAVEGVQSQTIVLMRALQRLRVPTVLFVNKIDRVGADPDRVIEAVHMRLTRDAFVVEEFDSDLTADLIAETAAGRAHPTCFGSAATGAGVDELIDAITTYLPVACAEADAPASGLVFKVERATAGEKVAYVRMFDGSVRVRERLHFEDGRDATITGVKVFEHGAAIDRPVVGAGQIAKLAGLRSVRTGDAIGSPPRRATQVFAPPMFEVAVVAHDVAQTAAMHAALVQLAEQDPMIGLRQDGERNETFVSLYGEVQQEVIQQTLGAELGIEIGFRDLTTICIERLRGAGHACERMGQPTNPYVATVGVCVEPAEPGAGVSLTLDVELVTIPLYIYKTVDAFRESMLDYVAAGPRGPSGWALPDFTVTVFECGYSSPTSNARDFRKLTEVVLAAAIRDAGTIVCEPVQRFRIDAPESSLAGLLRALARLRATPEQPTIEGEWLTLQGEITADAVPSLRRQLHGLTHGEGVLDVEFSRYAPR